MKVSAVGRRSSSRRVGLFFVTCLAVGASLEVFSRYAEDREFFSDLAVECLSILAFLILGLTVIFGIRRLCQSRRVLGAVIVAVGLIWLHACVGLTNEYGWLSFLPNQEQVRLTLNALEDFLWLTAVVFILGGFFFSILEAQFARDQLAGQHAALTKEVEERRRAEETLRASEQRFKSVFDTAHDAIFIKDLSGRYALVNAAMERLFGRPSSEFIGRTCDDLFEKRTAACINDIDHRVLAGQTVEDEHTLSLGGAMRVLHVVKVPMCDPAGQVVGLCGIARDITERKRAAEELQEASARFEAVIENTPMVAIQGFDRQGIIRHWNKASEQLYGFSKEEALGKSVADLLLSAKENVEFTALLNEIWEAGKPGEPKEWLVRTRDGQRRWVHSTMFPIVVRAGVAEVFCMDVEITELKQAEEALRESEEHFRTMIEQSPFSIQVMTPDGRIVQVNRAWEQLWGATLADTKNYSILEDEQLSRVGVMPYIRAAFAGAPTAVPAIEYDAGKQVSGGRKRWTQARIYPVKDEQGAVRHVILMHEDVTERRRVEEERRKLEAQLQQSQKWESLGVLAGGVAHDFNNLVMAIMGNAELASMETPPTSPVKDSLEDILQASRRAADLCRQLQAYSGKVQLSARPVDLSALLEEMTGVMKASLPENAQLAVTLEPDLPPIQADASQIHQAVMNLVTNASEALGDRPGTVFVSTGAMRCDRDYLSMAYSDEPLPEGTYVYLEVADTGCGIDEMTRGSIFDPFFTTKFVGRGLGLAAVLGIVRSHRGAIKVDSSPGQGTVFRVLFPPAREAAAEPEAVAEPGVVPRGTILVVDDEEAVRTVAKRMLEKAGFTVLTASDGAEAIEAFRAHNDHIVCIVLDVTMPHMAVEETVGELRTINESVPIVLASGYSEQDVAERLSAHNVAGFIQKPYRFRELLHKLRQALPK